MGLPKPVEDNLQISEEDRTETLKLGKATQEIEKLLESKKSEIEQYYRDIEGFIEWANGHPEDMAQSVQNGIAKLRQEALETKEMLRRILALTQEGLKKECRKVVIKGELAGEFAAEGDFARKLRYPRPVVRLARDIAKAMGEEKVLAQKDLKLGSQTLGLLQKMVDMMDNILGHLSRSSQYLAGPDLTSTFDILQALAQDIRREKQAFDMLKSFEKAHLETLIRLYRQEDEVLREEKDFAEQEKAREGA